MSGIMLVGRDVVQATSDPCVRCGGREFTVKSVKGHGLIFCSSCNEPFSALAAELPPPHDHPQDETPPGKSD